MHTLEKLFGSVHRAKLLKLFYQSPDSVLTVEESARLMKIPARIVKREFALLVSIGFIKHSIRTDEIVITQKQKKQKKTKNKKIEKNNLKQKKIEEEVVPKVKIKKKTVRGFSLSHTFPLLLSLRQLVLTSSPTLRERMAKYFKSKGPIKLVVLGGVFISDTHISETGDNGEADVVDASSQLDILIVGNSVKRGMVDQFISSLGVEMGKELTWALLSISEFEYRMALHDRFLRDIFDYPHEFLINKLGVE